MDPLVFRHKTEKYAVRHPSLPIFNKMRFLHKFLVYCCLQPISNIYPHSLASHHVRFLLLIILN